MTANDNADFVSQRYLESLPSGFPWSLFVVHDTRYVARNFDSPVGHFPVVEMVATGIAGVVFFRWRTKNGDNLVVAHADFDLTVLGPKRPDSSVITEHEDETNHGQGHEDAEQPQPRMLQVSPHDVILPARISVRQQNNSGSLMSGQHTVKSVAPPDVIGRRPEVAKKLGVVAAGRR